ncbi:MAG: hypothetical protein RLZZ501_1660 [Pseudomonadota bacterium]
MSHAAAVETDFLLQDMVESAQAAILILDATITVRYANRAAAGLFRTRPEAMAGRRLSLSWPPEPAGEESATGRAAPSHRVGTLVGEDEAGAPVLLTVQVIGAGAGPGDGCLICISTGGAEKPPDIARLEYLATHDPLTRLLNRQSLLDRLQTIGALCQRGGARAALLHIDLDRFKPVNDTLGHDAGDELLRQVAQRLRAALRQSDTVARIGGDEFIVILTDIHSAFDVEAIARKILDALAAEFPIRGRAVFISASIGVTLIPEDGTDAAVLVRNADMAMYQAKEAGANTLRFFTAEMNEQAARRLELEWGLRAALEQKRFRLRFMPIFDIRDRTLVAAEVLLRWDHPERGLIGAEAFIEVAESSGLIVAIGEWMLGELIDGLADWRDRGLPPCQIAVNLSLRQLRVPETFARAFERMQAYRLPPHLLEMEIAESVLRDGSPAVLQSLETIAGFGVSLAIDDFGSGYTSLRLLKRFPVRSLRIDRIFLRHQRIDREDGLLMRAMIAMANSLGIAIVGKGVETDGQLAFLRSHNCDHFQGYLAGQPLDRAALEALMARPPG